MRKVLVAVMMVVGLGVSSTGFAKEVWEEYREYSDWKDGQEVKAELVSRSDDIDEEDAFFLTPDKKRIYIILDNKGYCQKIAPKRKEYCDAKEMPRNGVEPGILDLNPASGQYENLGRQMIITFKKIQYKRDVDDKYIQVSGIRPVKIRLDPDPNAPRNTWVVPYLKLDGKIRCEYWEDPYEGYYNNSSVHHNVIFTANTGDEFYLEGEGGEPHKRLFDWCEIKDQVTVYGDILKWRTDNKIFFIRNIPPVTGKTE